MESEIHSDNAGGIPSIFCQPWWLDAVSPKSWAVIEVRKGGQLCGRLPYAFMRKYGFTYLIMPPLTQTLGVWVKDFGGKYVNKLNHEKEVMQELISKLPDCQLFLQNFHFSVTNWLPFHWAGFQQTTRYTYIIPKLSDLDAVWAGFQDKTKAEVRKAEKSLRVEESTDINAFLELNVLTFARQGRKLPYSKDLVIRLDTACAERSCRKILFAVDAEGRRHAAVYLVWDNSSCYYLMSGSNPSLRNSGALSLLIWESIKHAAKVSSRFDFEGSMIEPVERFVRGFGAIQFPYFQVSRKARLYRVIDGLKSSLKALLRG